MNKDQYQVAANWIGKVIQTLIQEHIYMQIFSNCHEGTFWSFKEAMQKSSRMTI